MMKKIAVYIFIVAVMAALLIPSAGMLIFGESQPAANEILSQRPALSDDQGKFNTNITNDLTDYIADRFAFRQQFITAFARIKATVFHESSSDDVILGKSDETADWLYYAKTEDDWLRRNVLDENSINSIAVTLSLMQEYAKSQGAEFAFTVAPNKNSVYNEYMPDIGDASGNQNNLSLLTAAIEKYGVKYADLKSALISAKEDENDDEPLYHRWDSHWTARGAARGMKCITEALGVDSHDWFNEEYSYEKVHKGDLYEMLYPAGKELDIDAVFKKDFSFTYMNEAVNDAGEIVYEDSGISYGEDGAPKYDSIRIDTVLNENAAEDSGSGRASGTSLLMFRDSFGNALYPFMADMFERATFSRQNPYRLDWLAGGKYEFCVVEIVERNISDLLKKAPVIPAPLRAVKNTEGAADDSAAFNENGLSYVSDLYKKYILNIENEDDINKTADGIKATAEISSEMPGYVKISGTYDESIFSSDGGSENSSIARRIFIDAGSGIYEASPAGENSDVGTRSFTAFIPEETLKDKRISVILSDICSVVLSSDIELEY